MNRRIGMAAVVGGLGVAAALTAWVLIPAGPRASGPLNHEVYIWQRDWNDGVGAAIDRASGRFAAVCALAAEVSWNGGQPEVVRIDVDFERLKSAGGAIGMALRIGPYQGPFAESGEPVDSLAALAVERIDAATVQAAPIAELQVDFDCSESNLDGYRRWVTAIRRRIAPTPLTITALPSWLDQAAFRALVAATDGFVLQVHSLERPRGPDEPMTLCDPRAARRAVERAGRLGTSFRVALPTYGYVLGFDAAGRLVGLRAEGPSPAWPAGTVLRPLRASPRELAGLVSGWAADRPAALRGILWYRLPTDQDELNWRWETLASVMEGRPPRAVIALRPVRPEPNVVELMLENTGDADAPLPVAIDVSWSGGRLIASDAIGGFEIESTGAFGARLRAAGPQIFEWISPGENRKLAWFRFDTDTEVEVHATPGVP